MPEGEIKFAREIGELIDIVQREQLRTRLLIVLNRTYPKYLTQLGTWGVLKKMGVVLTLRELDAEVAYLVEKQMIARETPGAQLRITARGRDFLDGHVHEIGLADPVTFRSSGH